MSRLWAYLQKRIPFYDLACMFLIYWIMHFNLQGVVLAVRGTSIEVLRTLLLYGVIVGWLLGRSNLKLRFVAFLSLTTGFILTLVHLGGIESSLWELFKAGFSYLYDLIVDLIMETSTADPSRWFSRLAILETRTEDMISSLPAWWAGIFSGFSVYNQVNTLISWGWILFLMTTWIAWITRRRNMPIWGVIPAGFLLAIMMTYTLESRYLLALLLGAGLILIGIVNHEVKQIEWKRIGIRGAEETRERVVAVIIGLAIYTTVFAGIMPSVRIHSIANFYQRLLHGDSQVGENDDSDFDRLGDTSDLFGIEQKVDLPRQQLIGSGPELEQRVAMIVSYPTVASTEPDLPRPARYWRSFSYDWYTGSGWLTSDTESITFRIGEEIAEIRSDYYEVFTQEIRVSNAIKGAVYAAGQPVTVDQEVIVVWRPVEETDGVLQQGRDQFATLIDERQYQVRSLVPTATEVDLRTQATEIPEWIKSRYLVLPDSIPDRVLNLASDIITNQPTAYDQAKAIEAFLRSYPYNLDIPVPPEDRDVADYFLFDLQTGYCDYYATSMVVLARAVGLPARLVVGYAGGYYDMEVNAYLVTEAEAHSWVEVYFGGIGWIPFEPTAARSVIDEQELDRPLPPELEQLPVSYVTVVKDQPPWGRSILIAAGIFLLGIWVWIRTDLIMLNRLESNNLALVIFSRLYQYSRWMGLGHQPSDTIYEFSQRLITSLKDLSSTERRKEIFSEGIEEVSILTDYAVPANYSDDQIKDYMKSRMIRLWKQLRVKLRLAVWICFWRATARKLKLVND